MGYRSIDLAAYPRRAHFEYFLSLPNPWLGVTAEVDVGPVKRFCAARQCSFYTAFIHIAALAADGVPQLRQRVRDGGIVEYDRCATSHVEPLPDGTYAYCTLRHDMDWDDYLPRAEQARRACRTGGDIVEDAGVEEYYFVTALPWLRYTQLIQPTGAEESNPRISWGRFEEDGRGRLMMPVTLLAHHALVDGAQLAAFYRNLEREIRRLEA